MLRGLRQVTFTAFAAAVAAFGAPNNSVSADDVRRATDGNGAAASDAYGAPTALPPNTVARARGDGWLFVDGKGMTLYTFDRDEGMPGKSACSVDCAKQWPPHLAPADARAGGDWSTIVRDDGSLQWAYRGRPLYRYAADIEPGFMFGDGAETLWRIAFRPIPTPRELALGKTVLGRVLTDSRGLTLYTSQSVCEDDCLKTWEPIVAPALAHGFGAFTVVTRADGLRQWAYRGRILYRRPNSDVRPGEISGQGQRGFSALVLEPAPPLPSWATVQSSDAGELIANDKGLTVYAHGANARGRRRPTLGARSCVDDCIDPQWIPFLAAPDARPVGSWALAKLPDGRQQWTYKGQKIFTNVKDRQPGEFKGILFGGDRSWSAIMRNGEPMQGVSVGG